MIRGTRLPALASASQLSLACSGWSDGSQFHGTALLARTRDEGVGEPEGELGCRGPAMRVTPVQPRRGVALDRVPHGSPDHYLLGEPTNLAPILDHGFLPLSAMPQRAKWQAVEAARSGIFPSLYGLLAEPVLGSEFRNSGVFLTPIDFRLLSDMTLALAPRVALPLSSVPLEHSALTYELGGHRQVFPVTAASLARTAETWTENWVREWFGRDRSMMFDYVPQGAVYPEGGIPLRAEWFESAP